MNADNGFDAYDYAYDYIMDRATTYEYTDIVEMLQDDGVPDVDVTDMAGEIVDLINSASVSVLFP